MKTPTRLFMRGHLEMGMIAFFIFVALSLLVVYLADPSIYTQALALTPSPTDRYPVPVTLLLVGVLGLITLLILGVIHHWRWVFWLMLMAFASSVLQIPITLLQIADVLPSSDPLWYGLFRMGSAVVEFALAVWMISVYRRKGVWAQGAKGHER